MIWQIILRIKDIVERLEKPLGVGRRGWVQQRYHEEHDINRCCNTQFGYFGDIPLDLGAVTVSNGSFCVLFGSEENTPWKLRRGSYDGKLVHAKFWTEEVAIGLSSSRIGQCYKSGIVTCS